MGKLIKKLHSMRFLRHKVIEETSQERKQFMYGYTECINELLIWANKEQLEITDKEIEKWAAGKVNEIDPDEYGYGDLLIEGAKWMRDKINLL